MEFFDLFRSSSSNRGCVVFTNRSVLTYILYLGNDELGTAGTVLTVTHTAWLHLTSDQASSVHTQETSTTRIPRGTNQHSQQVSAGIKDCPAMVKVEAGKAG